MVLCIIPAKIMKKVQSLPLFLGFQCLGVVKFCARGIVLAGRFAFEKSKPYYHLIAGTPAKQYCLNKTT